MDHLSTDQIMDFVSLTAPDCEAVKLSVTVNGHIRRCQTCLDRVRAFQRIYDEFGRLHVGRGLIRDAEQKNGDEQQAPEHFRQKQI